MEIGKRIKSMRLETGMQANELAEKIGINRMTLYRYESEETDSSIPAWIIIKLSNILNTTPDMLFGYTDKESATLTKLIMELPEEYRQEIVKHIKKQYSALVNAKLSPSRFKNEYKEKHIVNVWGTVSAGSGELLQDNYPEAVEVNDEAPVYDYAVKVSGDSMEPLFEHGQIIYVKTLGDDNKVRFGQIVIASVNGEAFVKKLVQRNGKILLVSLNVKYKNIVINEWDDFRILGTVVM